MSDKRLRADAPAGVTYHDRINWNTSYANTLRGLVWRVPGDGDLVIVSHREGIRALSDKRLKTPYCVHAEFVATVGDAEWSTSLELAGLYTIGKAGERAARRAVKAKKKPAKTAGRRSGKTTASCCRKLAC